MTSDSEEEYEAEVELGFVCDTVRPLQTPRGLHHEPDWTKWDGGQLGGRPSWLHNGIPSTRELECLECRTNLSFLVQLYCPLDDHPDAFHRSLYVFVCRSPGCRRQGDGKIFRLQLPQTNAFYASEGGATKLKDELDTKVALCLLCGQRATFKCSACQMATYCSKNHQKEHWHVGGHKQMCGKCLETQTIVESDEAEETLSANGSKWIFPERKIEIEEEPDPKEAANEHEAKMIAELDQTQDENEQDTELNVTQQELNEALGHTVEQDAQYVRFLTRVALAKDQVLRYCRWDNDAVLWVHSKDSLIGHNIPRCEQCGAERQFEFQVLPQMLHYLRVDHATSLSDITTRSCEWGTLVIYTCTKSCALETQSAEEFLHYQPAYTGTTER